MYQRSQSRAEEYRVDDTQQRQKRGWKEELRQLCEFCRAVLILESFPFAGGWVGGGESSLALQVHRFHALF